MPQTITARSLFSSQHTLTPLLTSATAALRGGAKFVSLAVGKFGLRALAQSLAREFGPRGIHVAHVVVDGLIDMPTVRHMFPERETHTLLSPDAITNTANRRQCRR